jgi:hypothetical protein
VERRLRDARHVGPAMSTLIDQNIAPARRIRMQRTMRPRMRSAWAFTPARNRIGRRLLPLRRRHARIVRRLRRQTELRLKLRHPRRKRQNQVDQGFLVQRLKGLAIHPIRESDPTALVKAADPNCLEPVASEIRLELGLNNYEYSSRPRNFNMNLVTGGIAMLVGRYFVIIPMMAIAGSLVAKKTVPASAGTFPTHVLKPGGRLVLLDSL